jgi:hypothetical protein
MNWRNPVTELPREGEIVAVLFQHWKKHKPLSCEVMFGTVGYYPDGKTAVVETEDFTGRGCFWVCLSNHNPAAFPEDVLAWMPASEFPIPEWIEHDTFWGPEL